MRQIIKDFAQILADTIPFADPLYEFGSYQVQGQEGFADLRTIFDASEYIGTDMREGPGVDRVLNLHDIDLPSNSVGSALCFDTLEHVEYPRRAMDELWRVLKPGGVLAISSHMNFPIHDHPYDYWRFTPEAFRSLLQVFDYTWVGWRGKEIFPHTVVGLGIKEKNAVDHDEMDTFLFLDLYHEWQEAEPDDEPFLSLQYNYYVKEHEGDVLGRIKTSAPLEANHRLTLVDEGQIYRVIAIGHGLANDGIIDRTAPRNLLAWVVKEGE